MQRATIYLVLLWLSTAVSGVWGDEPIRAIQGRDGRVQVARGNTVICELAAGLFDSDWRAAQATADGSQDGAGPGRAIRLVAPDGGVARGQATVVAEGDAMQAAYVFTPEQDMVLNSLHVAAEFTIEALAGGTWKADERAGEFPADFDSISLFNGPVRTLQIRTAGGESLEFRFPQPTSVLIQDNRQWGPSFTIRMYRSSREEQPFRKGAAVRVDFTLAGRGGIEVEHDAPVTIVADRDWIPLKLELDIQPGSALDFSSLGLQDAPAGKHGWLQSHADGTFTFEAQRDRPVRFYGVNLCFSAHYITHDQADRLAERLVRLGYNTVRFHHYESELVAGQPDSTQLNPDKLDQLDYLFAALTSRGIYVTTDLYVSRPVSIDSILPDYAAGRQDAMNAFKVLATNNDRAFENWKTFTRNLLTHVNPYTQRAYKDDPGLAWLSLINEGNLGNFLGLARDVPDFQRAWNLWLIARYRDRAGLAAAWGAILSDDEDPGQGSVRLDASLDGRDPRARDVVCFLAQVDRDFFVRATRFLREELGVKALVTNMNGWTNHVVNQLARVEMDYVDDHFYVDHPEFIEQPWRLPSRCPNTSPVAGGARGGRHITLTRLFDRPFTLSEYNYSAPGRYRGVGGILTGSLGSLQGWGVIWRFAYSHSRDNLFQPGRLGYFDMVSDPLSQAAERASICLFLRGDMRPAPHSLAVAMTRQDLAAPGARVPRLAPSWHWAGWVTRIGTRVVDDPAAPLPHDVVLPLGWATPESAYTGTQVAGVGDPYQLSDDELVAVLRQRGILREPNPTDPREYIFQSETGEITIDGPRDVMTLDTPCTVGGFAAAGETIQTQHGFQATVQDVPATIWVSALDAQPVVGSRRLLLTHLTDLQNTGIRYGERARQTLLDWGQLPHLVRAGRAEVRLQLAEAGAWRVWALSTGGARVAEVPAEVHDGTLVFTADVAGVPDQGAILCYEIARE
ncbi:MAG: hypothetical protein GXY58_16825 [Planctomycetaceae bacterium]|nr:hypothetical protein [Planctomycetaceae bacterium]